MISRIIRLSIISGSIPTILALGSCTCVSRYSVKKSDSLAVITFVCLPDTNYSLIISQSLGSACTITVLLNLNSRGSLTTCVHGVSTTGSTSNIVNATGRSGQLFGGTACGWISGSKGEELSDGPLRNAANGAMKVAHGVVNRSTAIDPDADIDSKPVIKLGQNTRMRTENFALRRISEARGSQIILEYPLDSALCTTPTKCGTQVKTEQ